MPRVICSLPNASDTISGIKFHRLDDGRMISDEIDEAAAARLASIPGYELDDEERAPVKPPEPPAPKLTKAQQKALDKAAAEEEARRKAEEEAAAAAEADANKGEGDQETENPEEVF